MILSGLLLVLVGAIGSAQTSGRSSGQASDQVSDQASEPSADDKAFQALATEATRSLQVNGVNRIGNLDLQKFTKQVSKVHAVIFNSDAAILMGSGSASRSTAVNLIKNNLVILQSADWQQTPPKVKPVLALHESFGATGYDDENYQVSTELWSLSQKSKREMNAALQMPAADAVKNIQHRKLQPIYQLGNGATGVGGGGDNVALEVKMELLDLAGLQPEAIRATLQAEIINMKVEASPFPVDGDIYWFSDLPFTLTISKAGYRAAPASVLPLINGDILHDLLIKKGFASGPLLHNWLIKTGPIK
jgi:hypothetical protein